MKGSSRTKTGGKKGNPAYRTPSVFKYKKALKAQRIKPKTPKSYK